MCLLVFCSNYFGCLNQKMNISVGQILDLTQNPISFAPMFDILSFHCLFHVCSLHPRFICFFFLYKLNTRSLNEILNICLSQVHFCAMTVRWLLFYVPTEIRGIKFKFTIEQPKKSQNLSELFILAVLSQRAAPGLLFTHHYKGLSPFLSALFRSAAVISQCPGLCCSLDRWVRCHTPLPYSLQG